MSATCVTSLTWKYVAIVSAVTSGDLRYGVVENPAKEDYVCIMLDRTFQFDIHKKYNIWAFSYLLEHEKHQQRT